MPEPLRGTLIGCGSLAETSLHVRKRFPDGSLEAVRDLDQENAHAATECFEVAASSQGALSVHHRAATGRTMTIEGSRGS